MRSLAGVAGTRTLLLVLGTAVSIVISRTLGPDGRGQYATVVALALTVVVLAHLSIEQVQVYAVSTGQSVAALKSNAVALGTILGFVAAALTLGAALILNYPARGSLQNVPLLLALLAIPPSIVVLYTTGLLLLEGKIKQLNRASLLAGIVQLAVLAFLAASHRLSVTWVVAAWLLNAALPLAVSLPTLRPRWSNFSRRLALEEVVGGLRYHGGLLSLYLLLRVDVLLLAGMAGARAVGLYTLAVSLIELTNVATDSVASVVLKSQTTMLLHDSAAFTAKIVGVSMVFAAAGVTILAATGVLLIPLVFGNAFRDSIGALLSLVPGVLALAATRPMGAYLLRLDRPWILTTLNFSAMAINIILNLILIPHFGIIGAGLASSVAYALLAAGYTAWFVRATGTRRRGFVPPHPAELVRRWRG